MSLAARPFALRAATLAALLTTSIAARADDTTSSNEPPRRTPLAAAAAILPGVVVDGSGHFVAGDSKTGYRLLALEGLGLGTLAVGFVPIVASGASRRLVGPAAALTVAGVGMFAISFLADLYGVLAPPGGTGRASG